MNNQQIKYLQAAAKKNKVVIITATQMKRPNISPKEILKGPTFVDYVDHLISNSK